MGLDANSYKGIDLISPLKFSSLIAWWDASQITGLSNNDPITSWPDLSGHSYDLVQAATSSEPLYKTSSALNGLPYVYFDGTDDFMVDTFGVTYNQPNTIIALVQLRDFSVGTQSVYDGATVARNSLVHASIHPHMLSIYAGNSIYNYAYPTEGEYCILTTIFNGASSSIRVSRTSLITGDAGVSSLAGLAMGCRYTGTQYFAAMNMAELMIYNKMLSSYELYQLEKYLANKWGLKTYSSYATDNFTRSNSATTMGACLSNQAWVAGSYQDANKPTLGISSNQGYFPVITGTDSHAYIESGKADCVITAKITFDSGADSDKGIIFRRVDGDNYFYLHVDSAADSLVLSRCLAGVRSDIASQAGMTVGLGDTVWLCCYLSGNDINCGMANGSTTQYIETTDANLTTATKHGLYNHSGNLSSFSYFSIDDYPF
jgi:hypothetical protein